MTLKEVKGEGVLFSTPNHTEHEKVLKVGHFVAAKRPGKIFGHPKPPRSSKIAEKHHFTCPHEAQRKSFGPGSLFPRREGGGGRVMTSNFQGRMEGGGWYQLSGK